MPLRRLLPLAAAAGAFLAACAPSAPPVAEEQLSGHGDTLATDLTEAAAAAWLGGDRWAVVSPSDQRVAILDFATHAVSTLGADVKDAYRGPFGVFVVRDTLYVVDWAFRQVTAWTTGGAFTRAIPGPGNTRGALPTARDGAGNWYVEQHPLPGSDGSGNKDSAAVLRLPADMSRVDTILRLTPLDLAEVVGDAGRRFERRVFSGEDAWGVLEDGSVWVARIYPNRVDWLGADGKQTKGQALPDKALTIGPADREAFLMRFPPELRSAAEKLPFSPVKAPFESGFTGGDGQVWLQKSRVIPDSVRRYQVVGRDGRLRRILSFVGYGKALAASPDAILVAEAVPGGWRFVRMLAAPKPEG
jgi:hypothetical protein